MGVLRFASSFLRSASFYRLFDRTGEDAFRREFALPKSGQTGASHPLSVAAIHFVDLQAGVEAIDLPELRACLQRMSDMCDNIYRGVSLRQRMTTIMLPTIIVLAAAFAVPLGLGNYGFIVGGFGSLLYTFLMAITLTFRFPAAENSIAEDFRRTRLYPAIPVLLLSAPAIFVTVLRGSIVYMVFMIAIMWVWMTAATAWPGIRRQLLLRKIRGSRSLTIDQRQRIAPFAANAFRSHRDVVDKMGTRQISDQANFLVSQFAHESMTLIEAMIALIDVQVELPTYARLPKVGYVIITGVVGAFGAYVYWGEMVTFVHRCGGGASATTIMGYFAWAPRVSPLAMEDQFNKSVSGTFIGFLTVHIAVWATDGKVLEVLWKLIALAAGHAMAVLCLTHLVGQLVRLIFSIKKGDLKDERDAQFEKAIECLDNFARAECEGSGVSTAGSLEVYGGESQPHYVHFRIKGREGS